MSSELHASFKYGDQVNSRPVFQAGTSSLRGNVRLEPAHQPRQQLHINTRGVKQATGGKGMTPDIEKPHVTHQNDMRHEDVKSRCDVEFDLNLKDYGRYMVMDWEDRGIPRRTITYVCDAAHMFQRLGPGLQEKCRYGMMQRFNKATSDRTRPDLH